MRRAAEIRLQAQVTVVSMVARELRGSACALRRALPAACRSEEGGGRAAPQLPRREPGSPQRPLSQERSFFNGYRKRLRVIRVFEFRL